MARRTLATAVLAVAMISGGLLPGMIPTAAAASCSSWTSETTPPPTIRVYRHATGAVDTVDFRTYAKNVLSREWIASWTTESLRSGALAVKSYAWYQVLHWRGGVNADGACFDVRDDTWDQVYDPSQPTWSTSAAAVDATWSWVVNKSGHIFPTYYNAGTSGEACGANANGWKAYQWGTQACGLAGMAAAQIILTYYYPGVSVSGAPSATASPTPSVVPSASATPSASPSPSATVKPTASPTPSASPSPSATVKPTASPSPSPSPTPAASAVTPTPTPTQRPSATATATAKASASPRPTPLPPPPADQQLPGGGQAGLSQASAPPPAPPSNPTPVIATAEPIGDIPVRPRTAVGRSGLLEGIDPWDGGVPMAAARSVATGQVVASAADLAALNAALERASPADPRLVTFRILFDPTLERLLTALAARFSTGPALAALLRLF